MKLLGSVLFLLGAILLVFAALAYRELHSAATSHAAPSADAMPFTKIVGPELFDPGYAKNKPAALVGIALSRIYIIGGGAALSLVIAVLILAMVSGERSVRPTP